MDAIRIKYVSPVFDGSGYAEAGRNYIMALHNAGVPVTVTPISFEKARPDLGETGKIISGLCNKFDDHNVIVVHLTPEHNPMFFNGEKDGVLKVSYSVWETTAIPDEWIGHLNMSDLNLVGCEWNACVYGECGVNKPIAVVPHGVNYTAGQGSVRLNEIAEKTRGKYVFYFIGQFIERKNIEMLLRCFWSEFSEKDNVALVIKTYGSNYSEAETTRLKAYFEMQKRMSSVKDAAPTYFIFDMLSSAEVAWMHNNFDCFISLTRGEGFGLPMIEAAVSGRRVITTNIGGPADFLDPAVHGLVDYRLEPVHNMPWIRWYNNRQFWAWADPVDAMKKMRMFYEESDNEKIASAVSVSSRLVRDAYSWESVGNLMLGKIESILRSI